MKFSLLITALLVFPSLATAAGGNPPPASNDEVEATLRDTEIAFAKSVADRDADRFAAFIAEDAIFMGGKGPTRGRKAIVDNWSVFFKEDRPILEWAPKYVAVSGTLGISTGPYTLTTRDEGGNPVTRTGTFSSTWRRNAEGRWQIIFDAGSAPCP